MVLTNCFPALTVFREKVESLECSKKLKKNAWALLDLLSLLEEQTIEKLEGKVHIQNRIVSIAQSLDARPIKKGKSTIQSASSNNASDEFLQPRGISHHS